MLAVIINCCAVIAASILGVVFGGKINARYTETILAALAIVVAILGVTYAIRSEDFLAVILCIVVGTVAGEALAIERRLESLGDKLKKRFEKPGENSTFTQSFVAGSLLFCVGPMAIVGSLQAGVAGDMSVILSKSVIDAVAALSFAMALGIGVLFAGFSVLLYQGAITLLATWLAPYLGDTVVTEMTAVGGVLMIGIAINMLDLKKEHIRVGNMLPALFMPCFYIPLSQWLKSLF